MDYNKIGQYDLIVAGSGFAGSVIARKSADIGKKVLILERRNHIAGNMFDEKDENGIIVHRYGPHIFHTNEKSVYDFITQFGNWSDFTLRCMVDMDGVIVPSPFNFRAIDMLYDTQEAVQIKSALSEEYPGQ